MPRSELRAALPSRQPQRAEGRRLPFYVRDEFGVAKGTVAPIFAGLKFFSLDTLGYDWPLFTEKKCARHAESGYPKSAVTRTAAA
jgi:hypothetical protein